MKTLTAVIGGASALFLAMGIARFAFTPVLPLMQSDYAFSDTVSGALASMNYFGYLAGAYIAKYISKSGRAYAFFVISVPLSLLFVAVMFFHSYPLWYFVRFISGLLSAVVFVTAAEFVMDFLLAESRPQMTGMIYSGIGGGMVMSGLTVPFLSSYYSSAEIWLWLALLSIIPAGLAVCLTPKPRRKTHTDTPPSKAVNSKIYLLCASYLFEGAGYIITGTFISVMVLRGTGSVMLSGYVWVIAGLGAVFITPLWAVIAKKAGLANALITAFAIQTLSVAAPVISPGVAVTMLGAVGFGGTFLGIVSLTLTYARQISPSGATTAVLTIFFSIGQMAGPLAAGYLADITGGFEKPVLMAAAFAAAGGIIIIILKLTGGKDAHT